MKRIALLLCFCSLAQVAVAWQRNFAENPSAEADRNRDGIPDGWTPQPAKSPAKVVWDDAVAHTGTASLRISDSANAAGKEWFDYTGRWVTNASRPVVAGKTYTLGLWIKMQDVTGDASACIAWWAGTNWLAESYTKRLRGTADWQHITIQASISAARSIALFRFATAFALSSRSVAVKEPCCHFFPDYTSRLTADTGSTESLTSATVRCGSANSCVYTISIPSAPRTGFTISTRSARMCCG